jgi:hypothetical protein
MTMSIVSFWRTQTSLARAGTREAWWLSGDLLCQDLAGRDLDADNVSEERGREHPRPRFAADSKGG